MEIALIIAVATILGAVALHASYLSIRSLVQKRRFARMNRRLNHL